MPEKTALNCDDCSACCEIVGHPPFLLELDNGVPRPIEGADSHADYHRLLASPPDAQAAYVTNHGAIDSPCTWLNAIDRRCRYYDFRPDICRSFEVGGKWCSRLRELHQIE
jgi:Fe-S-cluster containining protein